METFLARGKKLLLVLRGRNKYGKIIVLFACPVGGNKILRCYKFVCFLPIVLEVVLPYPSDL